MIVLYSRCRVNQSTNLSVFLYYIIFFVCFHCAFGLPCWGVPNLWGASPLSCSPLRITVARAKCSCVRKFTSTLQMPRQQVETEEDNVVGKEKRLTNKANTETVCR